MVEKHIDTCKYFEPAELNLASREIKCEHDDDLKTEDGRCIFSKEFHKKSSSSQSIEEGWEERFDKYKFLDGGARSDLKLKLIKNFIEKEISLARNEVEEQFKEIITLNDEDFVRQLEETRTEEGIKCKGLENIWQREKEDDDLIKDAVAEYKAELVEKGKAIKKTQWDKSPRFVDGEDKWGERYAEIDGDKTNGYNQALDDIINLIISPNKE
jgi:hypothetical protein